MTIKIKRSAVPAKVPTTGDLALGQLAMNTYDGKMYMKKDDGTEAIVEVGGGGSASYEVGQIVYGAAAPSTGTWLETGKYYSKATYPALAAAVGDVPDFSGATLSDTQMNGLGFNATIGFNSVNRYLIATNPSGTIGVVGFDGGYLGVSTDSGATWRPIASEVSNNWGEIRWLNNQFVAISSGSGDVLTSTDGVNWTYKSRCPNISTSASIAYGAGMYVAVAYGGNFINYSTDLITWVSVSTPAGMNRVIYDNGIFVAVGRSTYLIYSSTDGITWTQRSTGGSGEYNDVIYAGGRFVAVGTSAIFQTSTDGITWSARGPMATSQTQYQVAYSSSLSLYISVGAAGSIQSSPDATTWTTRMDNTTSAIVPVSNTCVVWDGTYFYVGTYNTTSTDSGYYYRSSNGTSWTALKHVSTMPFFVAGVACGKVIMAGKGAIDVSSAGTPWVLRNRWYTQYNAEQTTTPRQVAYGNGVYVVAGWLGPYVSSDLVNWTAPVVPNTNSPWVSCAYFLNGNFLVFGSNATVRTAPLSTSSTGGVYYSADGTTWNSAVVAGAYLAAAAYGAGLYVIVGSAGTIRTSPDLVTWTTRSAGAANFQDVIFANSIFVAVGASGACYSSPDGITWTSRSAGAQQFNRIIYANSLFVAVAASGTIYTSPDGITWTARTANVSTNQLNDVVWSSTLGLFCAVGNSGAITTSPDGITWTSRSTSIGSNHVAVKWVANTRFVIMTSTGGQTIVSTNGTAWSMDCSAVPSTGMMSDANGIAFILSTNYLQETSDGLDWEMIEPSSPGVFGNNTMVTTENNRHFVLCGSGQTLTSSDGYNFSLIKSAGNLAPYAVVYGNGMWLLMTVGNGSFPVVIHKSTNGTTWSRVARFGTLTTTTSSISNYADLVFSNGKFVLFFQNITSVQNPLYTVYTSTDGVTWTGIVNSASTFNNQRIAASPTSNAIIASPSSYIGSVRVSRDWGGSFGMAFTGDNVPSVCIDGTYIFSNYISNDNCQTFTAVNPGSPGTSNLAQYAMGKIGDYLLTVNGNNPSLRLMFNVKTGYARQILGQPSVGPAGSGMTAQSKRALYRVADKTFFIAAAQSPEMRPQSMLGFSAFNYNTTTTFFVPPSAPNFGLNSYICAVPT